MLSGGGDWVGGELACKLPAPFVQEVLPRCADDRSLPPRRLATRISWMLRVTCRVRSAVCRPRAAVRRKVSRDSSDTQKLVRGEGSLGTLQGQWYLHQRQDRRSDMPALHGSLRALEGRVMRKGAGSDAGPHQ